MDPFTYDRKIDYLSGTGLLYLEDHGSARLSLHPVAALLALQALCRHTIYLDDLVAADKTIFMCRRIGIRLVDDDIILLLLMDDSTDTAVCIPEHHVQILILLFRNIDGIWIQVLEHGIHACAHDTVQRERVYIGTVEFHKDGVMDLGPLAELEVLGLGTCIERKCCHQDNQIYVPFHSHA